MTYENQDFDALEDCHNEMKDQYEPTIEQFLRGIQELWKKERDSANDDSELAWFARGAGRLLKDYTQLQSAHDKLIMRIEDAPKAQFFYDDYGYPQLLQKIDGDEPPLNANGKFALVELTPEEMEKL